MAASWRCRTVGYKLLAVGPLFAADQFYRQGSVLAAANRAALFAGAIGVVVTCVFLAGLLERRDRTVLRMGVDSLLVLVTYMVGVVGVYYLR